MVIIKLSKLDKCLNITRQAAYKLARETLKEAVIYKNGKKHLNLSHPLFKQYYLRKFKDLKCCYNEFLYKHENECIKIESETKTGTKKLIPNLYSQQTKKELKEIGHLTLQQVVEQHGTMQYPHITKCLKTVLEVQKLSNQIHKERSKLISYSILKNTTTLYLDTLADALLNEGMEYTTQEIAKLCNTNSLQLNQFKDKMTRECSRYINSTRDSISKALEATQDPYM